MNVRNFGKFTIPIFPIGKNPREVRKSGISVQNHTTTEAIFFDKKGSLILLKIGSYIVQGK